CALFAGCGGKPHRAAPGGTTTEGGVRALRVYFLRGNALVPVTVSVPDTRAVATAAMQKLLASVPPGYRSAIPPGTRLESIAVSDGRATVRLSARRLTHSAEGQIV